MTNNVRFLDNNQSNNFAFSVQINTLDFGNSYHSKDFANSKRKYKSNF